MLSTKAGKRPLRSLTAHEKLEAIRRVHDGESKASVARDIGVPESTLRGWCKNEEKISYISRQSSPDTDDSMHMLYEPKEKKIKLSDMDTPFNLSLKSVDGLDKPINLKSDSTSKMLSERERNRAELARISVELGLNRPEMYSAGNSLADLTSNIGLLSQWNNLLLQQATSTAAASSSKKKIAAADTSSNVITSSNNLLTTFNKDSTTSSSSKLNGLDLPKLDSQKSVEDSVWYWLKTHQMLGFNQGTNLLGNLPSSTSNTSSSMTLPPTSSTTDQNSSWFWKWYKQYTQAAQQLQQQHQQQQQAASQQLQPQQNAQAILYQQLTKEAKEAKSAESPKAAEPSASADNAENQNKAETQGEKPQSNTNKARAVLDNLLLNNNNVQQTNCNGGKDAGDDLSQTEAIEHGEKFLKWLECCSEPSVTAMQIMQFRGLINNIKTGADRKNGDVQKTKVRRK